MKSLLVSDITIPPNRQRREFAEDAMQELISSIQDSAHGLLHPIVIRMDAGAPTLVAGERRLRAVKEIYELGCCFKHGGEFVPPGHVPVVELGDLSFLEAREAEWEENSRRKDLTIIEAAQATAELFELRQLQGKAPTAADIAREVFDLPASKPSGELGSAQAAVRSQLLVAKHAANPEVRKATSLREAVNIIKKADQAKQAQALAQAVGRTYSSKNLQLLNTNCLDWMAACPPETFDIILTDPPYGMDAQDFGDSNRPGDMKGHSYDDSYPTWLETMRVFAPATFAVAKAQAHAYLFCDIDRFPELRSLMSEAGWDVHRTPIIWHNPDGFRTPWPDRGPQRKYELILYATKGNKKTTKVAPDLISFRKDSAVGHPAQKPVELLKELLSRSALPGHKVLDAFAGSGATLEACYSMMLDCVGLELDPTHYGTALKRIQALSTDHWSCYDPRMQDLQCLHCER